MRWVGRIVCREHGPECRNSVCGSVYIPVEACVHFGVLFVMFGVNACELFSEFQPSVVVGLVDCCISLSLLVADLRDARVVAVDAVDAGGERVV